MESEPANTIEAELSSLIGHKFRRSQVSITDLANVILGEGRETLSAEHQADLQTIKENARAALRLTDGVLGLALHEMPPPSLHAVPLSLLASEVAQRAEAAARAEAHTFQSEHVSLSGNVACDLPLLLDAVEQAVEVLCRKTGSTEITFAVQPADQTIQILLRTGTLPQAWVDDQLRAWFQESDAHASLIDVLLCVRAVRYAGGQVRLLSATDGTREYGIGIGFPFPHEQSEPPRNAFLRGVIHAMRNSVQGIASASYDMLHDPAAFGGTTLNEAYQAEVQAVGRLAREAAGLVQGLADWDQLQDDALRIAPKPIQSNQLLNEVSDNVQRYISDTIRIVRRHPEVLPGIVADEKRLRQVLTTLLYGAAEATSTGVITLDAQDEGEVVRFTVMDEGNELDPNWMRSVRGLGLYIADHLVRLHGGTLTVTSTDEQGTIVAFTVPVSRPASTQ